MVSRSHNIMGRNQKHRQLFNLHTLNVVQYLKVSTLKLIKVDKLGASGASMMVYL